MEIQPGKCHVCVTFAVGPNELTKGDGNHAAGTVAATWQNWRGALGHRSSAQATTANSGAVGSVLDDDNILPDAFQTPRKNSR